MNRAFNFSAGPGILPEPVLREAQEALWNFHGTGLGLLEISHRSKAFEAVIASARERLARLLGVAGTHDVLLLQGGASTQFFQVPANLLRGQRATYLDTGRWASLAAAEAKRYGTVDVPFTSKGTGYDRVPEQGSWGQLPEGTAYLHYTSNNTVAGTEYDYIPDVDVPLVVDASSNILSRPMDMARHALIYAGAQKNLGPAGVTILVIRKDLYAAFDQNLPTMLRYEVQAQNDSMYNTPPTFAIFVVERVCAWIEEQGGLDVIASRNKAKADLLYHALDNSSLFRGKVQVGSRSRMNVTFTTGSDDRDAAFVKAANSAGLSELKGHKSVGGLRASIYNAQSLKAVQALVAFLADFEAKHA
jgi:phosphoserine aminotransferase